VIKLFNVLMSPLAQIESSKTLLSGNITQGAKVDEFERDLSVYVNNKNVVTTNSCTSAIHLALDTIKRVEKLPDNVNVLSTPLTCAATNFPIVHNDMRIRWCDVDKSTLNISYSDIKKKMDDSTRILMVVDWGGYPQNYEALLDLKNYYQSKFGKELFIIEDAAHAFGSIAYNQKVGHQDWLFTCFSFQAIKHLTTVDGGCVVTPEKYYKQARLSRWFGLDRDNKVDFRAGQDIEVAGFKFHMNDVNASIGIENLKIVNNFIDKQRANSEFLYNNINTDRIVPLDYQEFYNSSCWLYTIYVDDRKNFTKYMNEKGIEVNPVHRRNDTFSCLSHFNIGGLKTMDAIENNYVAIPNSWALDIDQLQYIADTINEF
jgi:dTDP-4-amino-4,6-dideoxy-D-glucose/dTDP-4-amino-2,4-dideoxy-beta-L-xylose transaminase